VNGIDVCKKPARTTLSRPHVLLLSAKAEKQEMIAGLDAGADDYLVKPFDPMNLLARLRVAQRNIAYQQELQQNISAMEELLQRHNLLGEMFAKASVTRPPPVSSRRWPRLRLLRRIRSTRCWPAARRKWSERRRSADDAGSATGDGQPASSRAPLILINEGLWIDLLLRRTTPAGHVRVLAGPHSVSERELVDFLAKTFNLVCTGIKSSLTEQGGTVLAPVISRATRAWSVTVRPGPLAPTSATTRSHCRRSPRR
jgi:hypothetical protein